MNLVWHLPYLEADDCTRRCMLLDLGTQHWERTRHRMKSNEDSTFYHIHPYSSIFIHILPSHLHDELLRTKFCQSLLALLRDSEVMFSSRVERIQNIQMPNQECKLGSVLHSQLEVVKEEPSTGQNCFGMQI